MPTITIVSGNINLRTASAHVAVWHTPRRGGLGNKEVYIDKASESPITNPVVRRVGVPTFTAAVPGTDPNISGRIVRQTFDLAEGEIIKVFVNVRPGWGKQPRTGSVFFRVRAGAAHRRVKFLMLNHADVSTTHAELEGCLDLMSLTDLDAAGVVMPPALRKMAEPIIVEKLITSNDVLQPEQAPAPRLEVVQIPRQDGTTMEVIQTRRRRAID